jgi:hypothetical protein
MHYTVLVFFVPTYVSALPVPSSGVGGGGGGGGGWGGW